jgi:hypothetical protein
MKVHTSDPIKLTVGIIEDTVRCYPDKFPIDLIDNQYFSGRMGFRINSDSWDDNFFWATMHSFSGKRKVFVLASDRPREARIEAYELWQIYGKPHNKGRCLRSYKESRLGHHLARTDMNGFLRNMCWSCEMEVRGYKWKRWHDNLYTPRKVVKIIRQLGELIKEENDKEYA